MNRMVNGVVGHEISCESLFLLAEVDAESEETLFSEIYERLIVWLKKRLPRWAQAVSDAEDLASVSIIVFCRRYSDPSTFGCCKSRGWSLMWLIARSILYDHTRQARRRQQRAPGFAKRCACVSAVPEQELEELVEDLAHHHSQEIAEIVRLLLEGNNQAEISKIVGISNRTLRRKLQSLRTDVESSGI